MSQELYAVLETAVDLLYFFFSSRRRHTRFDCDWSSDVCSSDLRRTLWFCFGSAALIVLLPFAWRARREDRDLWLWLASSVVAVVVGLRFFPHYYLQLLPPLTLLGVRGLDGIPPRGRARGFLGVPVSAAVSALYFL